MRKFFLRRFKVLLLLAAGLSTLLVLTSLPPNPTTGYSFILDHPFYRYNLSAEEPDDPTQSCVIPKFHPFHPSIWSYLTVTRPIRCTVRTPTITYVDDNGWLRINGSALEESGYRIGGSGGFVKKLGCRWRPVLRAGPDHTDDDHVTYGSEVILTETGADISAHEYVNVRCRNFAGVSVYENLHAHIANTTALHRPVATTLSRSPVNVLIIGLDSMSRQAFMRLMPRTYKYLKENLSMYVFTGMNKVGDNTFPNLIALLTGRAAYGPDLPDYSSGFDGWPLIWKNYSDAGYATMWAEDLPDFGLFNYLAKGFRKPPVHHYLRPFWLAVKESPTLRTSSHMCFGNVPRHQLQLEYVKRFVKKYGGQRKIPYFAFSFLAELSHDYLSQAAAADSDFENLFKFLNDNGYLNDTLLIAMSDHGHRFDAMRSTHIGRLEERLPFFAMHVPKQLMDSDRMTRQLNRNRGRLTTPYDTYATLVDVLDHVTKGSRLGDPRRADIGLGMTLFGIVPANRTCKDAGVPLHYCVCEPEEPIPVDDSRVRAAARALFNHINSLLSTVRDFCSELLPSTVISAQVLNPADKDIVDWTLVKHRIRIAVAAQPSNAIFEATVEVKRSNGSSKSTRNGVSYEAKVLGDVSRINKYGNQSACIRHDILRKYCYCQKSPVRWARKGTMASSRRIS